LSKAVNFEYLLKELKKSYESSPDYAKYKELIDIIRHMFEYSIYEMNENSNVTPFYNEFDKKISKLLEAYSFE
jgi:hypothetical protein